MKKRATLTLLISVLCFLLGRAVNANPISVTMTVDRNEVTTDDEIQIQVAVNGTQSASPPQILSSDDFEVQSAGTSSNVQIINGTTSISSTFNFILQPKKAGRFRLGPARVDVGGKSFDSQPVEITVVKSGTGTAKAGSRPFEVLTDVDNHSPFVGQQILWTFQFLTRGEMQNPRLDWPDFKGFWKEEVGKPQEMEKIIDGIRWRVTEIRIVLFPQTPGNLTVAPATLYGNAIVETPGRNGRQRMDSFFDDDFAFNFGRQTKRVTLRTSPIQMQVQPLPSEGRPSNFSGLVGTFRARTTLSKSDIAVGDSTTLSVEIEGLGNIRDAKLGELALSDFKTYDDQPSVKVGMEGAKFGGTKVFKKALVPLQPGSLTIPSINISYFDPTAKTYRVAATTPIVLKVRPGEGNETTAHTGVTASVANQKEVSVKGEDIMPIKHTLDRDPDALPPSLRWAYLVFAILFCPGTYAGARIYARRAALRRNDTGFLRRERAYRSFLAGSEKLNGAQDLYERSSVLLRGYLGDRFNFDGMALTPIDTERKLKPFGVSLPLIREAEELLKLCEQGQYGGGMAATETSTTLKSRLHSLVKQVEKEASA